MPAKACVVCGTPTTQRRCPTHRTNRNGSTRAWRKLRAHALNGQSCALCGQPATHADHITPLAYGGTNHPENIQPTCATCNLKKGAT